MTYITKEVLDRIKGRVVCIHGDSKMEFDDAASISDAFLGDELRIESVSARGGVVVLYFEKNPNIKNDIDTEWARRESSRTGMNVSFF